MFKVDDTTTRSLQRCTFALALAMSVLLAGPAGAGNGLAPIAEGAKATGRGGTKTAVADDATSVSANPALITELPPGRIDLTLSYFGERVEERTRFGTEQDDNFEAFVWPMFAVAFDPKPTKGDLELISYSSAPEGVAEEGYSWGGDMGDTRIAFSIQQPIRFSVMPTVTGAVRLGSKLSIGLSIGIPMTYLRFESSGSVGGGGSDSDFVPGGRVFVYRQANGTPVDPPQPFTAGTGNQVTWGEVFDAADNPSPNPPSPDDGSTDSIIKVEDVFGAGVLGQLGILWTPRGDLSLGLSLRPPGIIFSPKGKGTIDLTTAVAELRGDPSINALLGPVIDTYLPNGGTQGLKSDYDIEMDSIMIPAEISLGFAFWPISRWMVSLDVRYIFWQSAFNEIEIRAKGGTNADLNEINGSPTLRYRLKFDWRDQYVIALGTSFGVTDWLVLRAGFNHGKSPVPEGTADANSLVMENHVTFGFSLYPGDWDMDFAYVYGVPNKIRKDNGTSFSVEEHVLMFGVGTTF